jgi:50S ribosomal protein L16 3-hydroxylase
MKRSVLGGLAPRTFLQRHWQKRPLFVPGALPGFRGIVDERALYALAMREDVEARLVKRRGNRWETAHGPFASKIRLEDRNASLLVSGVNLHRRAADALLRRFDFVPQARLDDVMVSYATPGGGVGPHVDSYDVFLLQGPGKRAWTLWSPHKRDKQRYLANPGDLLYVPPGWRHDGVALEPCFTYSIGFRAPAGRELGAAFLDWLHERGLPDAKYRDAGLTPARSPASLPPPMVAFAEQALRGIRWSRGDVARFLGEYLTEPKPHVVFRPGRNSAPLRGSQVRLDPKTQLLYRGAQFFINGESFRASGREARALRALADRRSLAGAQLERGPLAKLVHEWQRHGYLHIEIPT